MPRFVCLWFPHLATDWLTLLKPELKHTPFVLKTSLHGRLVIMAANALAEKKGIYEGMVLADAKVLHTSLKVFEDKPNLCPQLLQRLAGWCIRFTPRTAIDLPRGLILDATGCPHLWGGEEAYIKDLLKRLKDRGYHARAAMADTIGAAWGLARFGCQVIAEQSKQSEALLDLPPEALRLDAETIEKLHKLGLTRIRDLISIPFPALRRRFGTSIIQRLNQALGSEEEFMQPIYTAEPYQERLPCHEPIAKAEGIEMALLQLLKVLCNRLYKEGKGLRTACFRGYRVDNKAVGIQISTNAPSNNVKHLLQLFQLKISAFEPGLGIELFLLVATKVEDHIPAQEAFWKHGGKFGDSRLSELMDRLSGKVGAGAIHRYLPVEHYWPERSFKKAASLNEQTSTEWKLDRPRPLRILSPPQPIEVTAPIPDYPPMLFRYKGKLHKIIKADGPERIEQEWWIEEVEHRDYYAVEDEAGARYWLFRSGHYDAEKKTTWFLHGFFA